MCVCVCVCARAHVCVCVCVCVECNEDTKFHRMVKDYKKGNVNNNNKLGDKKGRKRTSGSSRGG